MSADKLATSLSNKYVAHTEDPDSLTFAEEFQQNKHGRVRITLAPFTFTPSQDFPASQDADKPADEPNRGSVIEK